MAEDNQKPVIVQLHINKKHDYINVPIVATLAGGLVSVVGKQWWVGLLTVPGYETGDARARDARPAAAALLCIAVALTI